MIDLKCGKCKTVFPISPKEYLKRIQNENEVLHLINCPSCLTPMPYALQTALKNLVLASNNESDWEVGSRLEK
jgi:hypothetical protein